MWVSFYLAFCVFLVVSHLVSSSVQQQTSFPLQFRSNGRFKILQIADMHYANGAKTKCLDVLKSQRATCSDLNTTAFINRMILAEHPDLIVFTGDNIFGGDTKNPVSSLEAAFASAIKAGIPWAAILGNHDQESKLSREEVMEHIVKMDYTLSQVYPDNNSSLRIDGFGNYNLEVGGASLSELAGKSVLNLYFLDSGDYSHVRKVHGYGWIQENQKLWFRQRSALLQDAYKSDPLPQQKSAPALVYFHIPLPEVKELGRGTIVGIKQEEVGCARVNSGFLQAMVEAGDVKAAFFGHDHVNDFCGEVRGLSLCYGGGLGYHAYGKAGWYRRGRVVEASLVRDAANGQWQGVGQIRTWKRLDDANLSTIDMEVLWNEGNLFWSTTRSSNQND